MGSRYTAIAGVLALGLFQSGCQSSSSRCPTNEGTVEIWVDGKDGREAVIPVDDGIHSAIDIGSPILDSAWGLCLDQQGALYVLAKTTRNQAVLLIRTTDGVQRISITCPDDPLALGALDEIAKPCVDGDGTFYWMSHRPTVGTCFWAIDSATRRIQQVTANLSALEIMGDSRSELIVSPDDKVFAGWVDYARIGQPVLSGFIYSGGKTDNEKVPPYLLRSKSSGALFLRGHNLYFAWCRLSYGDDMGSASASDVLVGPTGITLSEEIVFDEIHPQWREKSRHDPDFYFIGSKPAEGNVLSHRLLWSSKASERFSETYAWTMVAKLPPLNLEVADIKPHIGQGGVYCEGSYVPGMSSLSIFEITLK